MLEESDVLKKADDSLLAKTHQEVIRSIQNMGETIDNFTNFFDPEKMKTEFKFQKIFDDTVLLVGKLLRRTELILEGDGNITLLSYEKELKQVIINIILNSRDAFEEKKILNGKIEINVSEDDAENLVRILIKDNAGGIPEDILPKIFDPFFSTKGIKGTGFGLYLVRLILDESLKGKISVYNNIAGVTFEIEIPKS
jgi:signal transduction histidine kinase